MILYFPVLPGSCSHPLCVVIDGNTSTGHTYKRPRTLWLCKRTPLLEGHLLSTHFTPMPWKHPAVSLLYVHATYTRTRNHVCAETYNIDAIVDLSHEGPPKELSPLSPQMDRWSLSRCEMAVNGDGINMYVNKCLCVCVLVLMWWWRWLLLMVVMLS